jgi:hypothetical protein
MNKLTNNKIKKRLKILHKEFPYLRKNTSKLYEVDENEQIN